MKNIGNVIFRVPSLIDVTKRRLGRRSSSVNHIRLPKYLTQDLITLNHTPSTSVSCDRTKYDYSRYFYSSKSYSCEKEISSGTSKNSKPKINGPIQGNNITKCWLPTQLSNGMKTKASSDSNDPFNQFKNSTVGNDLFDDQPRGRTRFKGSDMRVTQSQCYFLEERNLGPQRVVKKVVPYTPLDSSEIKSAIFLARLTKSETLLDRKVPYKKQSRYSSKEEKSTDSGPSIKSNGTEEANLYAIRYSDLLHKYVESEKVADTSNNGMLKPDASSISEQVKSDANIKQSSTNEVTKAQSENIYETQEQEPKKTSQEVQKEKAPFKTQPSPKAQSAKNSSKYTPKDNAAIAKKRKRQTVFEIFDNSESHKKWRANLRSYAHRKVPERFKSGKNKLEIAVDDQAISMKIKYLEKKKSLYEIYQEFFPFTPPRSELAAEGLHLRGELRRRNKAMQMLKGTEMEQRLKPFDDEWWSDPQTVRARRGGGSSRRLRPAPSGEPLDFRGPLKYIMDRKAKMRSDLDL